MVKDGLVVLPSQEGQTRFVLLTEAAAVWARIGEPSEALTLARSIRPGWRDRALGGIADGLARAGKVQPALDVARGIPNPQERALALTSVERALGAGGDIQQAEAVAREASLLLDQVPNVTVVGFSFRSDLIYGMMDPLLDAGAYAAARRVALSIRSPDGKQASINVLDTMAEIDAPDLITAAQESWQASNQVSNKQMRQAWQSQILHTLVRRGRVREAQAVLEATPQPQDRQPALLLFGEALATAGRLEALEVARQLSDAAQASRVLATIADELAKAGKFREALQAARRIEDPTLRGAHLAVIAVAAAAPPGLLNPP